MSRPPWSAVVRLCPLEARDTPAGSLASATVLVAAPTTVAAGQPITVTVAVQNTDSQTPAVTPTGSVGLVANGSLIGDLILASGGVFGTAVGTGSFVLPAGTFTLAGVYAGDSQVAGSISNGVGVVVQSPPGPPVVPPPPPGPPVVPPPVVPPIPPAPNTPRVATYAPPAVFDPATVPLPPPAPASAWVGSGPVIAAGSGPGASPLLTLIDGTTGAVGNKLMPYPDASRGGVRTAVGDVNGDFVPDVAVAPGPGGGPNVKVFNGVDGSLLHSFFAYPEDFTGGVWIALGDVNGDGAADIVTGPDAGGGPNVKVFDGRTRVELYSFFAYAPDFTGGVRVTAADVTGDGAIDVVVGAGVGGGPHVQVFNGPGLGRGQGFFAYESTARDGVFVAAADLDGDGVAEVVTGAGSAPRVRVFAGGSFAPGASFFAADPTAAGVPVGVVGGVGNGPAAIGTGAGPGSPNEVRRYDASGRLLGDPIRLDAGFLGGVFVGVTDLADGMPRQRRAVYDLWPGGEPE